MSDPTSNLQVTLSVAPDSSGAGTVDLVFSVQSDTEQKICTYMTPFEGFAGDFLDVHGASGEASYVGLMVKRGPPTESDYLTLKAGETHSVTFDLAEQYDLSGGGPFTVQFKGNEYSNQLPDSNVVEVPGP